MTVRGAANAPNVDDKTVCRPMPEGELPGFVPAAGWRFEREDLDQRIQDQTKAAVQQEVSQQ